MNLHELITEGCAIETPMSVPCPIAAVEVHGNQLFWVTQFPVSQQHAHVITFDRTKQVGEVGIEFFLGPQRVAYVSIFAEFSSVAPIQFMREQAAWLQHLSDSSHRAEFEEFVRQEKRALFFSANETATTRNTEERIDEATPNGGVYSIAYFQDVNGNPTVKSEAKKIETVEFDKDDNPIFRSHMEQ